MSTTSLVNFSLIKFYILYTKWKKEKIDKNNILLKNLVHCTDYWYIYCGDNFCFKAKGWTFGALGILLSHIGKKSSPFLPYKAWANGVRVPLVWWSFYCGDNFCFKAKGWTFGALGILLSHIEKKSSPFLPYKVWANGVKSTTSLVTPYKVERGRTSFQCGTTKCLRFQRSNPWPWSKNCSHNKRITKLVVL